MPVLRHYRRYEAAPAKASCAINTRRARAMRMAKSVLDAGWSMFRNQLQYKASRHGARYVEADERWTSQQCSECSALGG